MLKADVIKANEALKDLSEDQVAAIETLSKNDEDIVIGKRIGEIHGDYDRDIKEVLGMDKPSGMKTYEWLKKDILPSVKKAKETESALMKTKSDLETAQADLKKAQEDGATDESLMKRATDAEANAKRWKQKYEKDTEVLKTDLINEKKSNVIDNAKGKLETAASKLTFKDTAIIPESIQKMTITNAMDSILAKADPEFKEEGGKKSLVFRDRETKEILVNKANQMKPFTAGELLSQHEAVKDILAEPRQQGGGGSGNGDNQPNVNGSVDLSGAKNRIEADEMIGDYLSKKGIARDSVEFVEQSTTIREEQKVADLPLE